MEGMQPFRWGVFGPAGKVKAFAGDLQYAGSSPVLAALVADEEVGELPGVAQVADLERLLQAGVDAVYLATPWREHYHQVRQCLLHGVPVLCERPIAENGGQFKNLMQLSADTNTFMMEAMWIRFLPSIRKILSVVSAGTIGDVVSVKASINPKTINKSGHDAEATLATLMELGAYPVFLATLFLGKPEYVQAAGKLLPGKKRDTFSAFLSYRQGQYAFLETGLTLGTSSAVIQGDKGSLVIRNPWSAKPEGIEVDLVDGTKVLHRSDWPGMGLQYELDEVAACVRRGAIESPLYCHHFMLDVLHTLDAIRVQLS
jgi:scyllo-inositol 2-dehydrogenase (NADP+)